MPPAVLNTRRAKAPRSRICVFKLDITLALLDDGSCLRHSTSRFRIAPIRRIGATHLEVFCGTMSSVFHKQDSIV